MKQPHDFGEIVGACVDLGRSACGGSAQLTEALGITSSALAQLQECAWEDERSNLVVLRRLACLVNPAFQLDLAEVLLSPDLVRNELISMARNAA